jgi:hypothetical protein
VIYRSPFNHVRCGQDRTARCGWPLVLSTGSAKARHSAPSIAILTAVDASGLYLAADRIDELAGIVRARGMLIGLHGATVRWQSPAARAYFRHIDDIAATLTGCAARMGELAELTRRHAAAVVAAR